MVRPIKKVCYECGLIEGDPVHLKDFPDKHDYVQGALHYDGVKGQNVHPNQTTVDMQIAELDLATTISDFVDPKTIQ